MVFTKQHPEPEFDIDTEVDIRLRKVGPVITAYLDDVVDATYTLNAAQATALHEHTTLAL